MQDNTGFFAFSGIFSDICDRNFSYVMKISGKYKLRQMAGENVVIKHGEYGGDMTKIISLNSTSLFLWNRFYGKEFSTFDIADALKHEYGISETTAVNDAQNWCRSLKECGLID